MPRGDTGTNAAKRAARQLARQQGIPYTAALRRLSQQPRPPIPAEAIEAATVDPAAGLGEDDWSLEARFAREEAAQLAYWEQRRAGRPVRLWTASIEVRCAAVDAEEAWWRIALGYMRHPLYRVTGLQSRAVDLVEDDAAAQRDAAAERTVARLPDAEVDPAERDRLVADYPRRPMPWPDEWTPYGPEKAFDIADYAGALRLGAARAAGQDLAGLPDPQPLPPEVRAGLGFWRAVHHAEFLAGLDVGTARVRAEELAATVVDRAGRPLGRLVGVEPDDGFPSATDGQWIHPACWGGTGPLQQLWDDHDAEGLPASSLPRVLAAEADRLEQQWARENADMAAHEARLHTQPDGSRTISTRHEILTAGRAVGAEYRGKTPAEVRAAADHYDYMAARVYGKVVENDDDVRRIERATAQARALRQLADELEAQDQAGR